MIIKINSKFLLLLVAWLQISTSKTDWKPFLLSHFYVKQLLMIQNFLVKFKNFCETWVKIRLKTYETFVMMSANV